MYRPFAEGDLVLLIDRKGRRHMTRLESGKVFHTHAGGLSLSELIGQDEGKRFATSKGQTFLALRPTLSEFVLEMPRGAQVIYPKDLGAILMKADIFDGARVVEAGLGSGALTMALLRAVGEKGRLTTYEIRQDMADRGAKNIASFLGEHYSFSVKMQDVYQGIDEQDLDRVVLDVPEPWQAVPHAAAALVPGGIFLSYVPTVLQVHRLAEALQADGRFQMVETTELLERPWHVAQRSVRPTHRMVAHTGFITTARRCAPDKYVQRWEEMAPQ